MFEINFWGLDLLVTDVVYERGYTGSFDEPPEPPSVEFNIEGDYDQRLLDLIIDEDELYDMVLSHYDE